MERRAWLTFLSSNNYYLYLLLGLYKNLLDTKTKYPVFCGVTKNVNSTTRNILKTIGLNLIDLDTSVFPSIIVQNSQTKTSEHYAAAFTKLALLDTPIEKMFDKIVYIDTDVQVFENMDELFDKPHMSAIPDCYPMQDKTAMPYELGCSNFCSGLFVWDFKSNPSKGHDIISKLCTLNMNIGWHDQNVLNYFYQDWNKHEELHLSATYGLMNNKANFDKIDYKPKAIHYTGRLRADWPFIYQKKLKESQWKTGWVGFKEWVNELAEAAEFFNMAYNLNIPKLHAKNLILLTSAQEKIELYMNTADSYLYF